MSAHEQQRLSGYLDGELSPEERAEVEAHLGTCPECAARLADMGAVDALARELPLDVPSGYFEALPGRVRGRIEAQGVSRARTGPSKPRWQMPVWTWAAAAALVLAVVTPLTLTRLSHEPAADVPLATVSKALDEPQAAVPAAETSRSQRADDQAAWVEDPSAEADAQESVAKDRPAAAAPKASLRDNIAESPKVETPVAQSPPAAPSRQQAGHLEKDSRAYAAADAVVAEDEAIEEAFALEPAPTLGEAGAPMAMKASPQAMEAHRGARPAEKKTLLAADTDAYVRLTHAEPADADGWREHREAWRAFVAARPQSAHADEARVRVVEAGLAAWRLGGDPEDLDRARSDAEAYLARDDAQQGERVRRALEAAGDR